MRQTACAVVVGVGWQGELDRIHVNSTHSNRHADRGEEPSTADGSITTSRPSSYTETGRPPAHLGSARWSVSVELKPETCWWVGVSCVSGGLGGLGVLCTVKVESVSFLVFEISIIHRSERRVRPLPRLSTFNFLSKVSTTAATNKLPMANEAESNFWEAKLIAVQIVFTE